MDGILKKKLLIRHDELARRRAAINDEIARLNLLREELIREEERFKSEKREESEQPYLLKAESLASKLSMSASSFRRLVRNKAKGFPPPVSGLDSDDRWIWQEVEHWLEQSRMSETVVGS